MSDRIDSFRGDLDVLRGLVKLGEKSGQRRRAPARATRGQYVEIEPGVWVDPSTKIPVAQPVSRADAPMEEMGRRIANITDPASLLASAMGLSAEEASELGRLWNK